MLLGDLLPWCFNNLAGIRADRWKPGYKHIINVDTSFFTVLSKYGKLRSQVLFREKMVGCMLFIHGEDSGLNMRK